MKHSSWLLVAASVLALSGCGSTSNMKRSAEAPPPSAEQGRATFAADFSRYRHVIVRDFANQTRIGTRNPAKRAVREGQAVAAGKRFADEIAEGLQASSGFDSVERQGTPGPDTLVIEGSVTKYKPGNRAMRLMVGFGAGSANFDARVAFVDGASGRELSFMKVDKNSWFLGGVLAAMQSVDDFIDGAAEKVAEQTVRAKVAP